MRNGTSQEKLELRASEPSAELHAANERLLLDLVEREKIERALRQSEWEKTVMMRIADVFLRESDDGMYDAVLAIVREALNSRFGVFGYIEENGDLVFPTLSRDVWDKCAVAGKSIIFPSAAWGCSIWGMAIRERKAFRSAGPFHTPEGHIHIDNFLTVPLICGSETIGQVSVANKAEKYNEDDESLLVRIGAYIAPILKARVQRDRQEVERKQAEMSLRKLSEELELRVRQRTAELEKKNKELEKLNKVFVGRELRMIELKARIKELEKS